jgi:hypothetical protein
MSGSIIRRLKPEEEELLRKREELAAIRTILAERELEIVELRRQLAAFEGRYLQQVGVLYAELDEWKARIAELRARLDPSEDANATASAAREQARQTYQEAHGKDAETPEFTPSHDLKRLFREVAKRIHPDFARDEVDLERRTRLMAEANRAYERGEIEILRRLLDEYEHGADAVEGEGLGTELVRIIRQISAAKARIAAIERDLAALRQSEIALLKNESEESARSDRDLLAELAAAVKERIEEKKIEYEALAKERA